MSFKYYFYKTRVYECFIISQMRVRSTSIFRYIMHATPVAVAYICMGKIFDQRAWKIPCFVSAPHAGRFRSN
jgi:hypothetical protein